MSTCAQLALSNNLSHKSQQDIYVNNFLCTLSYCYFWRRKWLQNCQKILNGFPFRRLLRKHTSRCWFQLFGGGDWDVKSPRSIQRHSEYQCSCRFIGLHSSSCSLIIILWFNMLLSCLIFRTLLSFSLAFKPMNFLLFVDQNMHILCKLQHLETYITMALFCLRSLLPDYRLMRLLAKE